MTPGSEVPSGKRLTASRSKEPRSPQGNRGFFVSGCLQRMLAMHPSSRGLAPAYEAGSTQVRVLAGAPFCPMIHDPLKSRIRLVVSEMGSWARGVSNARGPGCPTISGRREESDPRRAESAQCPRSTRGASTSSESAAERSATGFENRGGHKPRRSIRPLSATCSCRPKDGHGPPKAANAGSSPAGSAMVIIA